ncbi:MAG: hypothetical protein KIT43_01320 [Bauldia sp.]|nr:hypothetical protein [Bauldia sp.]MCW5716232.1 hypothetical protein [Bauldia sp.]
MYRGVLMGEPEGVPVMLTIVNVVLEDREGGGLRAFSHDLLGLILSGAEREAVISKIAPAIVALFEYRGFRNVTVRPAKPLNEVLQLSSPRDVDVHIQTEQFVVELPAAA